MRQAKIASVCGVLACSALAAPLWPAAAQVVSAPVLPSSGEITTVAPVIVTGRVGVPDVGGGASTFTAQELEAVAKQAHADAVDARDSSRQCRSSDGLAPPESEEAGDFSLEALYDTEGQAQFALQKAADAAEAAGAAATDSRVAAARGEATSGDVEAAELARQAAVKAFQAAQVAAIEAHNRVADLQDEMRLFPGEDVNQLRAFVDDKSLERSHNGGIEGVYIPDEYKDLRLFNILAWQASDKGDPVLKITGRISNPRKGAISIPPLWFTAVDKYGSPLKSQQTVPQHQGKIPPGGSLPFTFTLKPMPDKTERAIVTFAPQNHPPMYMPTSLFCADGQAFPSGHNRTPKKR